MINNDFPRILTLLRKEQGFSQKKVAEDLGISQALLSHYEKGIRECGLNFVVKVADYYGVSCDYLLGRTPHRTGKKFTLNEVPDDSPARAKKNDSTQLEYNRRILVNSLNIVFAILRKIKSESLTNVVSHYLFSAVYKAFRVLYSSNPKNPQGLFAAPYKRHFGLANASMELSEANAACLISGEAVEDLEPLEKEKAPNLSPESITKKYPSFAASLFNLIQNVEQKMGIKKKQDH